ncbi:MAG: hypothetical protein ACRDKV_03675, partial [Solirubrobacterales bacterium]
RDLNAAAPNVKALFRALPRLRAPALRALPATTRLLDSAHPLVLRLHPALRDLVPVVEWLTAYRRELAAWFAKLAAIAQSSNQSGHMTRILIVLATEGLTIYDQREPSNRHNPYPLPGYLDNLGKPHLLAFDCANAAPAGDAPPCVEQGPFNFRGFTGSFPRVKEAP